MHSGFLTPGPRDPIHCTLLTAIPEGHHQTPSIMTLTNVPFLAIFTSWHSGHLNTAAIKSLAWEHMSKKSIIRHMKNGEVIGCLENWGKWALDLE